MRSAVRLLTLWIAAATLMMIGVGVSYADTPPLIEPMIWQFNRDYPAGTPADTSLSINTVYIKTHDGTDWMSTFDSHPAAVSGPASIQSLINVYGSQGISVAAWFVPKGTNYDAQLSLALQVIDSGVTALYADLEPFQGFCYLDCASLATNFWARVRQERPNARLGVIYDPRPWWWNQSATSQWFANSNVALPMCYWETYAGQGIFGDAAGCVAQAKADLSVLSPGRPLEYLPVLQGDSSAAAVQAALDSAIRSGAARVSLWRRGVVSQEVWDMIANYHAPSGPHCIENLIDGCIVRELSDGTVWLIRGGTRFRFRDWNEFGAMGYADRDIQTMPNGALGNVPVVPPEGSLIQEFGSNQVFIVLQGIRFLYVDGQGGSGPQPFIIPPGSGAQVPLIPPDLTRWREDGSPNSYLVLHSARMQLDALGEAAIAYLGLSTGPLNTVPSHGLDLIPVLEVKRGDIDCDGSVGAGDVTGLLRHAAGLNPSLCLSVSGDVNCSGGPRPDDALLVLLYFAETPLAVANCPAVGQPAPALLSG